VSWIDRHDAIGRLVDADDDRVVRVGCVGPRLRQADEHRSATLEFAFEVCELGVQEVGGQTVLARQVADRLRLRAHTRLRWAGGDHVAMGRGGIRQ
jgi:hypothetical protein